MPEPLVPSFAPPFPPLVAMGGAPLYLTGEDELRLTVFNGAAGVTVTLTGRVLEFGQTRPTPFKQTLVPATDRSASAIVLGLGDGWLLNCQVIVSAGTPLLGQTFARLSLVHGHTSGADELFTLAENYITAKQSVSYPGVNGTRSLDGAGALRSIIGTTPGAGAEVSETVPTGARWELIAFEADLTTSAAAANRLPTLTLDDGANVYFHSSATGNELASLTWANGWVQGLAFIFDGTRQIAQSFIPTNNRLGSGHRIRTQTFGIQGADQYASPKYLVREWIEGA
jgi:hypothetical protein